MSLYDAPSGENLPFVKYNAKAGRWYKKEGEQEIEIQNPVFVADFANAKKAWMFYMEGQAPNIVEFPNLTSQVAKPSENHKLGIILNLFSKANFGGVVQFSSNSINTCKAINGLYEQYEAAPESKQGKLPVVKFTGANPVKGNYGTNYEPVFIIEKWVDRPAEFDDAQTQQVAPAPQQVASSASEF